MALPVSVLEAKGMGRERGVRGFYLVTLSTGEKVECGRHRTAIVAASRAHEEVYSGREKGRVRVGAGR